jgi:RNA polymerase sigma-70 factor (ECF subfamily)
VNRSPDPLAGRTPAGLGDANASLVLRMAAGDQAALTALYDATSAHVYGLALRMLRDADEAEEVTLDAYSQAWRDASHFVGSRANVMGWLLVIARTRSLDALRRRARHERIARAASTLLEDAPDASLAATAHDEARRVRAALATLAPEQREPLTLAYFGGLSQSEIAERLGWPLGTVKTRMRAGLAKLRDALGVAVTA